MFKHLLTSWIVLVLAVNACLAFAPGVSDQEACSDACCAMVHCVTAAEPLLASQCCTINSQQDSEPNRLQSFAIGNQKQESKASSVVWTLQTSFSCLKPTRFPSSPTRHFAGSSSRYLENSTFLI